MQNMYKLVISEKPSVGKSIAAVLGANERKDGYFMGNGYIVSWCFGHLAELTDAEAYDEKYGKWSKEDLPILPDVWQYTVTRDKKKQLDLLRALMNRDDVSEVINATRLFSVMYHRTLNVGRVVSPTLALLVQREAEISAFQPEAFYTVNLGFGEFSASGERMKEKAEEYIAAGALWNGGVFAYKLKYVLGKARELLGSSDYETLFKGYADLKKISFDYAVVEAEKSIEVLRYSGTWKDLGTWNTLTEAMEENTVGDARLNETCDNVHVINELGVPILVMGLKDAVVSASPEGILVSDKEQSSYIKPFVDAIDQQVMFAEKSWGSYRVMDVEEDSMTVKVTLNPGHKMNYHSHEKRDEVWTVISGTGTTIVDGMEQPVKPGDVVTMAAGCKHTVIAGNAGLQLIEVQLGTEISVADKKKYEMPL